MADGQIEIVILNSEQLRKLASIIYYQEAEAIKSIKFRSEPELAKYLRDCQANYDSVVALLDAGGDLSKSCRLFGSDDVDDDGTGRRAPNIAEDIFDYLVTGANFALQMVRNYTLRMNYLTKISEHAAALGQALKDLDPKCRNAMLEYTRKYQSPASRSFSRSLKESGIRFDQLVTRYQAKRGFEGRFQDLADEQKIEVYEEIIEASGRGRATVNDLSRAFGAAGIAMLLLTAGLMVWDIFSSEHIVQKATRDAVVAVASVGGAILGEVVGAAVPTLVSGIEAVASAQLFVLLSGLITGFVGAFLLGEFVGCLVDVIFGTGGAAPFSAEGHRCYVAPMPDGQQLAREIAHQDH